LALATTERRRGGCCITCSARSRTRDDGEALFEAVCEHELEGVVAKRRLGRYLPGGRGRVKTKNREYWRYEMERESAISPDMGR
jgi:ATP-dependent DNA ligase